MRHAQQVIHPAFVRFYFSQGKRKRFVELVGKYIYHFGIVGGNGHIYPLIHRAGQHKPLVVVGMLADQVHPSRCGYDYRLFIETLLEILL
jgi:hypothetical protein